MRLCLKHKLAVPEKNTNSAPVDREKFLELRSRTFELELAQNCMLLTVHLVRMCAAGPCEDSLVDKRVRPIPWAAMPGNWRICLRSRPLWRKQFGAVSDRMSLSQSFIDNLPDEYGRSDGRTDGSKCDMTDRGKIDFELTSRQIVRYEDKLCARGPRGCRY